VALANQLRLLTPRRPIIIGIAGCSGSGKTTLARELVRQLDATLLPLDYYYRDLSHIPFAERAVTNFDHPDSLESDLIVQHVKTLAEGVAIDCPIYDFSQHIRVPAHTEHLVPTSVVIVEGILALHYEPLRALYDFGIYVNAPHELCLTRRIYRDIHERGRTEESVRQQFAATAHPMADKFVIPSAQYANLTVEGTDALDWSVEQVMRDLRRLRPINGIQH
jgi:uridine kinase